MDFLPGSDPMSDLLKLEDVGIDFSLRSRATKKTILEDVDITLREGDRLGLVARNGEGKSTLLKIMAKVLAPSRGSVNWHFNIQVSLLSLGLGFKNELSGRDNVFLSSILAGFSRRDSSKMINKVEEFCELGLYFDEPVKAYSSGMRAKLGFATALMNQADVLLIDETLSVGDAHFKSRAKDALLGKVSEVRAVVLVSHSKVQIKQICNRAALLSGSRCVSGSVSEVLELYEEKLSG
jgi:lipopolysaccharide transport system ATP-binding protein